ncbi:MAG: hypothetical protein CM15mP120_05260 [Pseudomonadota bacterium]|nr:MAG: hypothetical protein CM15mP120_05260 [Pseudomonadota bacterium]
MTVLKTKVFSCPQPLIALTHQLSPRPRVAHEDRYCWSGISGIAAADAMSPLPDVTLFEADPRLGGHGQSSVLLSEQVYSVDTGFVAFNERNTRRFRLAATAGCYIPTAHMSLSVSCPPRNFEYEPAI